MKAFKRLQKILLFFISLVVFTSATSCYLTKTVSIEVLQYPASPLPSKTQRIAFVDKTCPENRDSIGFYYTLDHTVLYSEFPADSILSLSFINGMKSTIDRSGFYEINDETIPNQNCTFDKKNKILQLKQTINADILISLESLTINDITTFSQNFFDEVVGQMFLHLSTKIHIYSLKSNTLIKELSLQDSMSWNTYAFTAEEAYQQLPKRYDVFPEAYFWFGEDFAQIFCPYWIDNNRMIFNSYFDDLLKKGTNATELNNWQRASYYWREAEKSKNKALSSYASYNLAVYEEINGNIDNALEQIKKAQARKNDDFFDRYFIFLQSEMKKKELLELLKN